MNLTFQRRTDLALRALRRLSVTPGSMPGAELATALGTTTAFLPQVMSPLVRAGWVVSDRGPGGGYRITDEGRSVSILDVVERTEGHPPNGRCVLRDEPCPGEQSCGIHPVWAEARGVLIEGLSRIPAVPQGATK
ncbi:MAG TPA: Rrf2 family transcriptional regulator [Acidimicrobiia bacterium]|jgi:Rrf2 family protein|nr:Rrf2 family transcriptional regulator [Acidimicrobiia bacterium]